MTIRGKVVIVTGAARGIGKAIAEEFGKAGACLFLIARSKDELEQITLHLARYECDVLAESYDIADPRQVDLAVEAGLKRFGRVDVLVNNAGVQGPIGPVEDLDFWECKRGWRDRSSSQVLPLRRVEGCNRETYRNGCRGSKGVRHHSECDSTGKCQNEDDRTGALCWREGRNGVPAKVERVGQGRRCVSIFSCGVGSYFGL